MNFLQSISWSSADPDVVLVQLEEYFPGIGNLANCQQSPKYHSEGNAWIHSFMVAQICSEVTTLPGFIKRAKELLLAAAIAHDISKFETQQIDGDKITFYGHAEKAAERCPEFGKRLGFNAETTEYLCWLVKNHMQAHSLPERKVAKRLEFYQHPCWPLLSALQAADARSSWKNQDGSEHGEVHSDWFEEDRKSLLDKVRRVVKRQRLEKAISAALRERDIEPGPIYSEATRQAVFYSGTDGELVAFAVGYALGRDAKQLNQEG